MERRNLALLCAGVLCFWLFALAFGTAQGGGLRRQSPAVQTAVQPQGPVQLTAEPPALELPCRAACLIDQQTGTVLYEKNADQQMPIASITKVMTLLLTFEAVHNGQLTMDTPVPVSEQAAYLPSRISSCSSPLMINAGCVWSGRLLSRSLDFIFGKRTKMDGFPSASYFTTLSYCRARNSSGLLVTLISYPP